LPIKPDDMNDMKKNESITAAAGNFSVKGNVVDIISKKIFPGKLIVE
jgi:hypothetical protein